MIQVVFDTNVLVSALLKPAGLEGRLLSLALTDLIRLCVSSNVLAEYEAVLPRARFKLHPIAVETALSELSRHSHRVAVNRRLTVSAHEADNRFIECAEAASADFLITGNTRHFPKRWKGTRIVTSREFLEIISQAIDAGEPS